MKNLFKYLVVHPLLALLLVILLLLVAIGVLSLTQTGTGLLVQLAERALPALSLEGVRGTLVDEINAESLVWEQDGIKVDAQGAVFKPNIELKFPLKVTVKQLTAKRLVIDLPPSEDTPYEPFVVPDLRLPVDAALENIALEELVINQGETAITIKNAVLGAYTDAGKLYLTQLDGKLAGNLKTVTIKAAGEMELSEPFPLLLDASIDSDSEVLGTGKLTLKATGELQNYRADLSGDWQYGDYPTYQLAAKGQGNFEGMMLDSVSLVGEAGDADLQGKFVWSPELEWDLKGVAENVKPEYFSPDVNGEIDVALSSTGALKDEQSITLKVEKLEGTLRGFPLKATLDAELQGSDLLLHDLDALVGDNRLKATGRADEKLSLDWKLDAPKLAQFHPDVTGDLAGEGSLSGKVDGSQFKLNISRLAGDVMDYPLDAKGELSLNDQVVSAKDLTLNVGENLLTLNGVADESAGIDWLIDAPKLAALYPDLYGQLKGKGNAKGLLDGSRLALRIDELEGKVKDYPVKAEGSVRVEDKLLSAKDLKVYVGDNLVSLNGIADEASGIDWVIDAPKLKEFYPELSGRLKGKGNAKGLLDGSRLALQIDELKGKVKDYPVDAKGALRVEDKLLSADHLEIHVGDNLLSLNGLADENTGIDWWIDAQELAALYPELSGRLKGSGNAKGLLDGSRLALQIDELEGKVKDYPVKAEGSVRVEGQLLSAKDLKVYVGENLVSLNGIADEASGIDWGIDAPKLAELYPELSGFLKGNGNAKGLLDGSRLALQIDELEGKVLDYPVKAEGSIGVEEQLLSAKGLKVYVGDNLVSLNGIADEASGIDWLIDAPKLKELYPDLSGQLKGKGNAKGLLDGSRLALKIDELEGKVQGYPVKAEGSVRVEDKLLSAEGLKVYVGDNLVSLNGVADEASGIDWLIDAPKLKELYPGLSGQLKGKGNARGLLDGSRFALQIDELKGKVKDYPVKAEGSVRVERKLLSAKELKVYVGENLVSLNGTADEASGVDWLIDAPKLKELYPELSGKLKGKGTAKGLLDGSRLALQIDELEGKVLDYPVKAEGSVRVDNKLLSAKDLKVYVGENLVSLNGVADEASGIDWLIDAPKLKELYPGLSGQLKGKGNAKGLLDGSRLALNIDKLEGKVKGYPVKAEGSVRVVNKLLSAKDLKVYVGENLMSLNGTADEDSGIDWLIDAPKLAVLHPELSGQLKGRGNAKGLLDGSRLALNVDKLEGKVKGYPVKVEGGVRVAGKLLSAKNLKIYAGDNLVSLNGTADEDSGIDWVVDAPKLAVLHPELSGFLKGKGNARGLMDGSRLSVRVDELKGRVKEYPLQAKGEIKLLNQLITANQFQLNVGENTLRFNGVADEKTGIDWVIDAPKLAVLHPELAGFLKGKGNAKGLLDGSRVSVRLDELQGRVKGYPLYAKGEVKLANKLITANQFQLNVGKNTVRLDGVADEKTGINWSIDAPELVALHPELIGHLKGNGNAKGLLDGSRLSVQVAKLEGRVQGFPLNAQGGVRLNNGLLAVDDFRVVSGQNNIRLNGVADERRGINWSLDAPQLAQMNPSLKGNLQGSGNVSGLLDGSRLTARIDKLNGRVMEYPLSAKGQVLVRGKQLSVKDLGVNVGENAIRLNGVLDEKTGLAWSLNAPKLVQLSPALDGSVKGRGNIRGTLDAASIVLNIAALDGRVKGYPVSAAGTVQLQNKKDLVANNLRVNVGANAIRLNGSLDEVKGVDWQIDANKLVQLHPAIDGQLKGAGNLKGKLDGSSFTLRVYKLGGRVKQYPLQLSGDISAKGKVLMVRNVLVNAGQNTIKLDGGMGDAIGLNWQLDARNIGQLVPGVNASAIGNGTLRGKLDGSVLDVQIARLQGQYEGRPLSVKGAANVQGKRINLSQLQVVAGQNSLLVNGQVSEPLNVTWRLDGRNLAQAWPGLAGGLQGEGTISGAMSRPQLKGFLKGGNVRYQDMSVQAVDINISQNGANYSVDGVLRNIRQGQNVLNYVDIKGQGTIERHNATLAAVHKEGKLNVTLDGGLRNGQWNGAVNTLSLRDTVAGDWQLTAPIRINASDKAVTVSNSCLANRQNARLCAQTSWASHSGVVAKGQLQQVPLAMARAFLPANIQLPGLLNADYQFEQRNGRPVASVNIQLPDNAIAITQDRGRKETFRYTNARANVVLNDRNATVDAQLDIVGHGQMRTQGRVILSPENNQHQVDLRTTVNMPSITWLQRFSPQVDALTGSVVGDVRVTGLLAKPQVVGTARLQNASLYLPETGSRLSDINLTVQANRPDQLAINGTLRAGSGQLTATGALQMTNLPDWSANLRIQGSDLLLMNSHEIQAKVSPDLNVKAGPQSIVITGTVRIPETTVTLRELPTTASVRSDDIVIVGGGRSQPTNNVVIQPDSGKPLYIQPNVTIELGDRVSFSGFGLAARMTGRMRILRNRQGVVAEGALNVVNGVYKAYGQNLKIERGRLLFNGPVENPGLDVRATRSVEDGITVGISLGGSVQVPESTLFSNPVQTQTDTLSYLLTGHSLASVGGGESAILTQAITGLGLSGGQGMAQKLGGQLGLDDVGLNANGGDYTQSELSLGKRLGPKLYVKYIVGLFDSLQKVAVTYDINKKLQLEAASSSAQQSIDLIYKIDSNRGPFGN